MHPDEGRLNDYADGLLGSDEAVAVAAHLERCEPCRVRVDAIRSLNERLAALPREIKPRRDLRPAVPAPAGARPGWPARRWLQAAAVVGLMVAAAAVARVASGPGGASGAVGDGVVAGVVPAGAYTDATRALRSVLEARRAEVPPDAARLVERNLAAVDGAIRELERARADHPSDLALARMLDQQYRTRLELLRSAVALVEG